MKENMWNNKNLIKILLENGMAIMPTDTIYGLVGRALRREVVEKIYKVKKRDPDKPLIILISDIKDLEKFSIILSGEQSKRITEFWPGPVSIILDCFDEKLEYLHRGTKSLSFRLPKIESLKNLISKTGPLIATSANCEGSPPATTIEEAKNYFKDSVNLYIDGGAIFNKHSKLIKLNNDGTILVIRE